MTRIFEYTDHALDIHSSWVDGLFYNENTQELAVELDEPVFFYGNVASDRWETIKRNAKTSGGRAYNAFVKNSIVVTRLGMESSWEDVQFVLASDNVFTGPPIVLPSDNVVPLPYNTYHISYEVEGQTLLAKIKAVSDFEALDNFRETLSAFGMEVSKVVEITRFFDTV